jgi:hypothetical protein
LEQHNAHLLRRDDQDSPIGPRDGSMPRFEAIHMDMEDTPTADSPVVQIEQVAEAIDLKVISTSSHENSKGEQPSVEPHAPTHSETPPQESVRRNEQVREEPPLSQPQQEAASSAQTEPPPIQLVREPTETLLLLPRVEPAQTDIPQIEPPQPELKVEPAQAHIPQAEPQQRPHQTDSHPEPPQQSHSAPPHSTRTEPPPSAPLPHDKPLHRPEAHLQIPVVAEAIPPTQEEKHQGHPKDTIKQEILQNHQPHIHENHVAIPQAENLNGATHPDLEIASKDLTKWKEEDIGGWLAGLGLSEYQHNFSKEKVTGRALRELVRRADDSSLLQLLSSSLDMRFGDVLIS